MEGKKRPRIGGPTRRPTPSAYLRPSYPLAGCSPAEPTSVSPGEQSIAERRQRSKINQELPVRKAGKSVAKEWPFFVQRMGSTSNGTSAFCGSGAPFGYQRESGIAS